MTLTWKDLVTTILALCIVVFSYFTINGHQLPMISGYRWAIGILLIIGIFMCGLGSSPTITAGSPWMITTTVLGIASLIVIITGLILGTKTMFLAVAGAILTLWAIATLRHLIGG